MNSVELPLSRRDELAWSVETERRDNGLTFYDSQAMGPGEGQNWLRAKQGRRRLAE